MVGVDDHYNFKYHKVPKQPKVLALFNFVWQAKPKYFDSHILKLPLLVRDFFFIIPQKKKKRMAKSIFGPKFPIEEHKITIDLQHSRYTQC